MVASRPRPAAEAALRRLPPVAPVLTAWVVFGAVAWTLLWRAERLQASAHDTAFFEQLVWNAAHGRGLVSGYHGARFLGLHFSPLLMGPAALACPADAPAARSGLPDHPVGPVETGAGVVRG